MKVLKVALAVTLAVGLVLGLALPGLAASDETETNPEVECKPGHRWLKGIVTDINEADEIFTIERGEQTTDIRVNEGTRYFKVNFPLRRLLALRRNVIGAAPTEGQEQLGAIEQANQIKLRVMEQANIPGKGKALGRQALMSVESQELAPSLLAQGGDNGKPKQLQGYLNWLRRFGEEVTFDDLAVEDRVIVRVVPNEGDPLAKLVLIFKPSPYKRVVGEIEIDDDIITITPDEGNPVDLTYNGDTRFILCGTHFLMENEEAVAIYVEVEEDGDKVNLAKRITQGCSRPEVTDSASN